MKICKKCDAIALDNYCTMCGNKAVETDKCECGADVFTKYCGNCGKKRVKT